MNPDDLKAFISSYEGMIIDWDRGYEFLDKELQADRIEKGMLEGIEKGRNEGMLYEAREMLLDALDAKFPNKIPADVHAIIQALNNKILLKKLHRSAIQSANLEAFKKAIQELPAESLTNS